VNLFSLARRPSNILSNQGVLGRCTGKTLNFRSCPLSRTGRCEATSHSLCEGLASAKLRTCRLRTESPGIASEGHSSMLLIALTLVLANVEFSSSSHRSASCPKAR